ncbi:hypothetical protein ACFLQW_03300 [Candidatus Zixiibacteriota bacterium]
MENITPTLLGELIGQVRTVPAAGNEALNAAADPHGDPGKFTALIDEINRVIAPPVPVTAETVFIRAMEVVSDEVNEHGGRFAQDEFAGLCELIIDSPVLVAHDKHQLPVARNFKAEVIDRDGRPWIKVWFYWPKDAAGAQDLAARIDAGVLREVSIGFEFKRPECSVCGRDIRECEHQPFAESKHPDGGVRPIHYIYRDIVRVLETSLVYRGATPGTRIGTGLFFNKAHEAKACCTPISAGADVDICRPQSPPSRRADIPASLGTTIERLFEVGLANGRPISSVPDLLREDNCGSRFVVTPLVEGLPLVVIKRARDVLLFDPDRNEFGAKVLRIRDELVARITDDFAGYGWLVRPLPERKHNHLTLFLEWIGSLNDEDFFSRPVIEQRRLVSRIFNRGRFIRPLPYRGVDREQLARAVQLLSSAAGCRIHPANSAVCPPPEGHELRRKQHLWLQITDRAATADGGWSYTLALADGDDFCELPQQVHSPQCYPIGRIVPVVGLPTVSADGDLQLFDAAIRYTPARRNRPDSISVIQRIVKPIKACPGQMA